MYQCSKGPLQLELKLARVLVFWRNDNGGGGKDFNAAKAVLEFSIDIEYNVQYHFPIKQKI